jgi:hypothetical protein
MRISVENSVNEVNFSEFFGKTAVIFCFFGDGIMERWSNVMGVCGNVACYIVDINDPSTFDYV